MEGKRGERGYKDGDILISKNKKLLESIYPDSKEFEKKLDENSIKNLIKHSLFELSFSYNDIYFSKLRLSKIYLNSFLNIPKRILILIFVRAPISMQKNLFRL